MTYSKLLFLTTLSLGAIGSSTVLAAQSTILPNDLTSTAAKLSREVLKIAETGDLEATRKIESSGNLDAIIKAIKILKCAGVLLQQQKNYGPFITDYASFLNIEIGSNSNADFLLQALKEKIKATDPKHPLLTSSGKEFPDNQSVLAPINLFLTNLKDENYEKQSKYSKEIRDLEDEFEENQSQYSKGFSALRLKSKFQREKTTLEKNRDNLKYKNPQINLNEKKLLEAIGTLPIFTKKEDLQAALKICLAGANSTDNNTEAYCLSRKAFLFDAFSLSSGTNFPQLEETILRNFELYKKSFRILNITHEILKLGTHGSKFDYGSFLEEKNKEGKSPNDLINQLMEESEEYKSLKEKEVLKIITDKEDKIAKEREWTFTIPRDMLIMQIQELESLIEDLQDAKKTLDDQIKKIETKQLKFKSKDLSDLNEQLQQIGDSLLKLTMQKDRLEASGINPEISYLFRTLPPHSTAHSLKEALEMVLNNNDDINYNYMFTHKKKLLTEVEDPAENLKKAREEADSRRRKIKIYSDQIRDAKNLLEKIRLEKQKRLEKKKRLEEQNLLEKIRLEEKKRLEAEEEELNYV